MSKYIWPTYLGIFVISTRPKLDREYRKYFEFESWRESAGKMAVKLED